MSLAGKYCLWHRNNTSRSLAGGDSSKEQEIERRARRTRMMFSSVLSSIFSRMSM